MDYVFDGYEKDTVRFPHDEAGLYMHRIDEQVITDAVTTIQTAAPDLSWVYLEYTDDMGHRYGDGQPFYEALKLLDSQMGRLWKAIEYREKNFKEAWLLVITTDHGRDAATGKNHGGQSDRERSTWIVASDPFSNNYVRYYTPAIVDIMPTIARFLNLRIPQEVQRECDGIPLLGPVSIAKPSVIYTQGFLDITWQPLQPTGNLRIWLSNTNQFKEGGTDAYRLLREMPLKEGHAVIDISNEKTNFLKLVLEAPHNIINRWVIRQPETIQTELKQ